MKWRANELVFTDRLGPALVCDEVGKDNYIVAHVSPDDLSRLHWNIVSADNILGIATVPKVLLDLQQRLAGLGPKSEEAMGR